MIPDKIYLIGISKKNIYRCTAQKKSEEDIEYIRVDKISEILEAYGQKARNTYIKTKKPFDGGYAIAFDDIDILIQEL